MKKKNNAQLGEMNPKVDYAFKIEFPKAEKGGIIENEMLQKWVKFINNPSSEEVEMFSSEYVEIGEAKKILSIASLKNKIRDLYYAREDARRERASWEEYKENFVKNLLEKGTKEILKQGIAEGEHRNAIETARRMISQNYDINTIANLTTLSPEEIQKLK